MQDQEASRAAVLAWRQLYLTYSVIFKALERSIASQKVTLPQAMALSTIKNGEGPMTPSRLAQYLTQETQSVTGLIDRMEKQGWVRRVRDLKDRRAIRLELTEAGAAKLEETVRPGADVTTLMFADLEVKQIQEVTDLLQRVYLTGAKHLRIDLEAETPPVVAV